MLPFKNKVVKIEVSGATLRAVLEHAVARSSEDVAPGRFLQISGVRFAFDGRQPAGSRVVDVTVNGAPLDGKRTYTIASSDYIAIDGGDGYAMLKTARVLIPAERAQFDSDVLQAAIVAKKVIAPKTDGRIKRLDQYQNQKSECL